MKNKFLRFTVFEKKSPPINTFHTLLGEQADYKFQRATWLRR